jgi:hypothetical protein
MNIDASECVKLQRIHYKMFIPNWNAPLHSYLCGLLVSANNVVDCKDWGHRFLICYIRFVNIFFSFPGLKMYIRYRIVRLLSVM